MISQCLSKLCALTFNHLHLIDYIAWFWHFIFLPIVVTVKKKALNSQNKQNIYWNIAIIAYSPSHSSYQNLEKYLVQIVLFTRKNYIKILKMFIKWMFVSIFGHFNTKVCMYNSIKKLYFIHTHGNWWGNSRAP